MGSNSVTTVERLHEGNWPVWSRRVKYLLADLGLDDALTDSASPNSKKVMAKLVALVQDEWVAPVDQRPPVATQQKHGRCFKEGSLGSQQPGSKSCGGS